MPQPPNMRPITEATLDNRIARAVSAVGSETQKAITAKYAISTLPQVSKYFGPNGPDGWQFGPNLRDDVTASKWTVSAGKITHANQNTEYPDFVNAPDDIALRRETLCDGRFGVTIGPYRTDAGATDSRRAGIIFREQEDGSHLLAYLRDGLAGGTRSLSLWRYNGNLWTAGTPASNYYTQIGAAVSLTDKAMSPPTQDVYIDLEAEIIGNTVSLYVGGKLAHGPNTILSASPQKPGRVGLNAPVTAAKEYTNIRVVEYDWRRPNLNKINTIVCSGSSMTFGTGSTVPNGSTAYPAQLQNQLQAVLGTGVTVLNRGVEGQSTVDMLALIDAQLATLAPQLFVIETSPNDFKPGKVLSMDTTESSLRTMIHKCKAAGVTPVLMTSTPINPDYAGTEFDINSWALANDANGRTRRLAAEQNVLLVDQAKAYADMSYMVDAAHMNDAGYVKMAQNVTDVLLGSKRY